MLLRSCRRPARGSLPCFMASHSGSRSVTRRSSWWYCEYGSRFLSSRSGWKLPVDGAEPDPCHIELDYLTASDRIRRMLASRACRSRVSSLGLTRAHFRKLLLNFASESNVRLLPSNLVHDALDSAIVGEATNAGSLEQAPQVLRSLLREFEYFAKDGCSSGAYTVDRRLQQQRLHELADLSQPHDWYSLARALKRKLIVHCGPTNSGKTYSALKHLKESSSGVYCGPLRLLAWEIHEKLCSQGVPCNLVTGQEVRYAEGAEHTACTVEMADMSKIVDCAVIDEAQMMGNSSRGHSFTRAVLGIPARTVHLCGDASTVDLVEDICELTNDDFEVCRYERLSSLRIEKPLTGLSQIRRGDCVVAFSRKHIYRLRSEIERRTGLRVCVIYGSLPPETRQAQARIFNDPQSGYDVLVASDAIGMGLNLNIRRVVFSSLDKFDGEERRMLTVSEILQIGGRAGRAFSQYDSGVVTCIRSETLRNNHGYLVSCMNKKPELLDQAGLSPSFETLELFSQQRPDLSFSALLEMFGEYATLDGMYFMSKVMDEHIEIASALEHLPLSLKDRYTMCMAPAGSPPIIEFLKSYAEQFVYENRVSIGVQFNESEIPRTSKQLQDLETVHNVLDLYVWLAFRYPDEFPEQELALEQRETVQQLIHGGLNSFSNRGQLRERVLRQKMQRKSKKTVKEQD